MNLRKQELEKAKERYITEVFIDDGSEEAQKCKLACLSIAEAFIENYFSNYGENTDADEEEFLDFAREQSFTLISCGIKQKHNEEAIKNVNMLLTAFMRTVYEMYFEIDNVVGAC